MPKRTKTDAQKLADKERMRMKRKNIKDIGGSLYENNK